MTNSGYWGTPTATIDWCEHNYEITHYIAEFWNTITNLVMILFPLYGIRWCLKLRKKANDHYFHIPNSLIACHFALMTVGFGSWLFHMTLLYSMQLLDEIPMIYATAVMIYSNYELIQTIDADLNQTKRSRLKLNLVLAALILACSAITYVYTVHLTNPIFHEVCYGLLVGVALCECILVIKKLKLSPRLYVLSLFYYIFGFLLWNIDNKLCGYLRDYRLFINSFFLNDTTTSKVIAYAFDWLLILVKSLSEFHSLWHLFTGYAAYMSILFILEGTYETRIAKLNKDKQQQQRREGGGKKIVQNKNRKPIKLKFFNLFYQLNGEYVMDDKFKV